MRGLLLLATAVIVTIALPSCGTDDDNVLGAEPQLPIPQPTQGWWIMYEQSYCGDIALSTEFRIWFKEHPTVSAVVPNTDPYIHADNIGLSSFSLDDYAIYRCATLTWTEVVESPTDTEARIKAREFKAFTDTTRFTEGIYNICEAYVTHNPNSTPKP